MATSEEGKEKTQKTPTKAQGWGGLYGDKDKDTNVKKEVLANPEVVKAQEEAIIEEANARKEIASLTRKEVASKTNKFVSADQQYQEGAAFREEYKKKKEEADALCKTYTAGIHANQAKQEELDKLIAQEKQHTEEQEDLETAKQELASQIESFAQRVTDFDQEKEVFAAMVEQKVNELLAERSVDLDQKEEELNALEAEILDVGKRWRQFLYNEGEKRMWNNRQMPTVNSLQDKINNVLAKLGV